MRAVIQRVNNASVIIEDQIYNSINKGLLVFLGVKPNDEDKDIDYIINKIINLRIFEDEKNKMNLSVKDIDGEILIISQFTLYGDCRHGRRPSFILAGSPEVAEVVYDKFIERILKEPLTIKTGQFQAQMNVKLENDGPVTMLLDSEKVF